VAVGVRGKKYWYFDIPKHEDGARIAATSVLWTIPKSPDGSRRSRI
jgi:hypothetical protein